MPAVTKRAAERCRGDEGSTLILAVTVMMILVTLTVALQARTLSSLKFMRHAQDADAALAAADAGLAKAVYRIENAQFTDAYTESSPVGSNPQYKYQAQRIGPTPPTEFVVSVRGKRGDASKAVRALVTRDALFPYALFGYQGLTLDGSTNVGNIQFSVASAVNASSVGVRVGTNGMITCRGGMASNVMFESAGGFSGCPSSQWTALDNKRPRIDLSAPTPNQGCPADGKSFGPIVKLTFDLAVAAKLKAALGTTLTTLIAATSGLVTTATTEELPVMLVDGSAGPFVCRQDVTLSGIIMPTGTAPVQIYVLDKPTGACSSLNMSDAIVNAAATTGTPLGKARNFQIYKDGDCPMTLGSGNTSDTLSYNGILYAPDTVMEVNGGKQLQGSIMVGQMKINGGPNIIIKWDDDLKTYYGQKWRVSRYAEVSNSDLTFTGP